MPSAITRAKLFVQANGYLPHTLARSLMEAGYDPTLIAGLVRVWRAA